MTSAKLRNVTAFILLGSHLGLLGLVGALTAADKFTPDEMFILIGILGPLFAAYTTAVIRYILRDQDEATRDAPAGLAKAIVVIGIPSTFLIVIGAGILWKAYGPLVFENLIKLVGAAETAVGAYVGMIVARLFGADDENK